MTVLVTCGYQKTWCDFAQTRLRQMGIDDPLLPQRSALSPHDLTDKMCAIHKLSFDGADSVEQVTPGKAWQITAADLFVSNADQEIWGWADNRNIFFLNFWRDFDPMCKFVLVYGSPAESIACNLGEQAALPEDINSVLDGWISYHEQLLRFYQEYPDQCLLVHIDLFGKNAKGVTKKLVDRFDVPARRVNSFQNMPQTAVLQLIADRLLGGREQDHELMAELESSADLPALNGAASHTVPLQAHKEFVEAQETILSERQQKEESAKLRNQLDLARAELSSSVQAVSDEKMETSRLQDELDLVGEKITEEARKVATKSQENQLLVKQLHQVRDELELYFGKYQDMRAEQEKTANQTSLREQKQKPRETPEKMDVTIDLRSYVSGLGWYDAEEHGRWAGPELISTVKLPTLGPGRYRLELEVVDAMDLEIVKNMTLKLDGRRLSTSMLILSNIGGRLAPLRRMKARMQKVERPYPICIIANVSIETKTSQNISPTLLLAYSKTISPSSYGQPDTRSLSVCVKTINLIKVG